MVTPKYKVKDEKVSQCPAYSPGPVMDCERLLRVLYEPEHIKEGKIIPSSISLNDLKSRGFSIDRKKYVDVESLTKRISSQKKRFPEKRAICFSSRIPCEDIRNLKDNETGKRECVVIDEIDKKDIPINKAHAAIYSAYKVGKGGLRGIRSQLVEIMNKNIIPHEDLLEDLSETKN